MLKTLLLGFTLCPAIVLAQAHSIGVDPRVELLSILFKLAGNPEYSQGRVPSYEKAIAAHFAPFREHEAVRLARELRQTGGVSYDAVMNMAVHLSDVDSLDERVPFDQAGSKLDARWKGAQARRFVAAARRFARDSKFNQFFESQSGLYSLTGQRLRAFVAANADLEWFNRFFGRKSTARLIIVPGMANGGASYGASLTAADGVDELYAIPGVWNVDSDGQPVFAGDWANTLVHEFVHSYANPLIERYAKALAASGEKLYQPLRAEMTAQAYGNGETLLKESLVRASTARYVLEHQGPEALERAIREEHGRSFLWTRNLTALLGEYAADRTSYPDMEKFMPRLISFFRTEADRVDEIIKAYENARPRVVSISIADGAQDVEPGQRDLVIRFDRAMAKSRFAIARTGPTPMPTLGKPSFDETGTTLTVSMTLEPARDYAFSLNWPGGGSFQSEAGAVLRPVTVKFRTRAAAQ